MKRQVIGGLTLGLVLGASCNGVPHAAGTDQSDQFSALLQLRVSAVKKVIGFRPPASTFLQSSGQAQSDPDPTRSGANNEIPSSLAAAIPSQPLTEGEPYRSSATQQFVCNIGYRRKQCDEEMVVLRKALAHYPVAQLGNWTWILVRSEDWKAILRPRGLDLDSPAFTFYPRRETFIEEALVTQVPVRDRELLLKWSMSREDLLDLAIRHELGHALCNEPDERNAERVAKLLEQRKPVSCEVKAEPKQNARHHASLN